MTDVGHSMSIPARQQSGIARLPVLVVSMVLTASLALVALDRLFLPERFTIRDVVVTGDAPNVDPALVVGTVRELGPRSWFSVDLDEVETVVREVPWVFGVNVRRKWPGTLVIHVTQARPFALWNDVSWIGASGQTVPLPEDFTGVRLPRLAGPPDQLANVLERYRELQQVFAEVDFDVRSLVLDARGAWRLEMAGVDADSDRTIVVRLGREQVMARAVRLVSVLTGEFGEELDDIAAFDLRYPNGFAAAMVDEMHADDSLSMAPQPTMSLAGQETRVP